MTTVAHSGVVLVTFTDFDVDHDEVGGALRAAGLEVRHAPKLGENTREILEEVGYSEADIDGMLASGAAR